MAIDGREHGHRRDKPVTLAGKRLYVEGLFAGVAQRLAQLHHRRVQRMVEVEVRERQMPSFEIITNQGVEEMDINVKDMLSGMFGQQKKKRKMTVAEAFD